MVLTLSRSRTIVDVIGNTSIVALTGDGEWNYLSAGVWTTPDEQLRESMWDKIWW